MLLHYLVVPGLGDGNGSRPEGTSVRTDEVAPAERGDTAAAAAATTTTTTTTTAAPAVPADGAPPIAEIADIAHVVCAA